MARRSAWHLLAAIVGLLPWTALRGGGRVLGTIAGSVLRIRRAHVREAMEVAGIVAADRATRAMYRSLAIAALEFLWLAARGDVALHHASVDPSARAAWNRARSAGRGVVIAATHTGNWDLAACAMARETELLVVTKRLSNPSLDRFWQSTRARQGVTLASGGGALSRAHAVLARGGTVAMMIDQVPPNASSACRVEFLGRPAWADRAPAALAARTGAPFVVAACERRSDGEHVLRILRVIEPPRRPGRRWVEHATSVATAALDDFVRARPCQWLWLHRRWNAPRPGASGAGGRDRGVDRVHGATTIAA